MTFFEKLSDWLHMSGDVPPALKAAGITRDRLTALKAALEAEQQKPPRIAVIGETGVGKTSTVNALFGVDQAVAHDKACTQLEMEIVGTRGRVVHVFDMPGVGEDLDADEAHFETYRRVLPTVDVVLWILKADNRAIANVQRSLERLVGEDILDVRRLVVAMNQVDLVQPGSWEQELGLPSPEQLLAIEKRRVDVAEKLRRKVRLPERHVVGYSALKAYELDALFEALIEACDETRRWVLYDRAIHAGPSVDEQRSHAGKGEA